MSTGNIKKIMFMGSKVNFPGAFPENGQQMPSWWPVPRPEAGKTQRPAGIKKVLQGKAA
jgi:hypothetical protein